MAILILDPISKFLKVINETQKRPPKVSKIQNRYKEHSNKKKLENIPPKSGHSDSRSNFEIFKNETQKRPPKVLKKSKTDIRSPQIK